MRKTIMISVGILFVGLALIFGNSKMNGNALAQTQVREVVLLMCTADAVSPVPPMPHPILISAASSSANTLPVRGKECAQGLADLFKAGYRLDNVQAMFNATGSLFTLTK
jgi:hypothetical protein